MSGNVPTGSLFIVFCEFFGLSLFGFVSLIKLVNRRCCYVWIWRLVGSTIQSKEEEKTLHFAPCTQLYSCHFNAQVLAWEPASATPMHKSFVPPHLRHTGGKAGKITSYSPASVSLGGGVNTRFHFFAQKVGGEGFTFDLSAVTFSCCLVIWTFDINYVRSSRPCCLRLKTFFKSWRRDLRKTVTAVSTRALVCTAKYPGAGSLPQCLGTSLAFTLALSA